MSEFHSNRLHRLLAVGQLLVCAGCLALAHATPAGSQGDSAEQLLAASHEADDSGKLSQAESLAREAIAMAEAEQNPRLAAEGQRQLGQVLIALNRYQEAEATLQQSLTALEPDGHSESLAQTLMASARLPR